MVKIWKVVRETVCDTCKKSPAIKCVVCGKDTCTACGNWITGYGKISFSSIYGVCYKHSKRELEKAIIDMAGISQEVFNVYK